MGSHAQSNYNPLAHPLSQAWAAQKPKLLALKWWNCWALSQLPKLHIPRSWVHWLEAFCALRPISLVQLLIKFANTDFEFTNAENLFEVQLQDYQLWWIWSLSLNNTTRPAIHHGLAMQIWTVLCPKSPCRHSQFPVSYNKSHHHLLLV